MKKTIVGVDLAKKVIQVCVVQAKQIVSNDEMSPAQFRSWLALPFTHRSPSIYTLSQQVPIA